MGDRLLRATCLTGLLALSMAMANPMVVPSGWEDPPGDLGARACTDRPYRIETESHAGILKKEMVQVAARRDGARIRGHYVFTSLEKGAPFPTEFTIWLPVVIEGTQPTEGIDSIAHPVARVQGKILRRLDASTERCGPRIEDEGTGLRWYSWGVHGKGKSEQFVVDIEYFQPYIRLGERDHLPYLPILPNFQQHIRERHFAPRDFALVLDSATSAQFRMLPGGNQKATWLKRNRLQVLMDGEGPLIFRRER